MNDIIVISKNELTELVEGIVKSSVRHDEPQKVERRFLSVEQAAVYLNLAKQTLYGLTSKRSIPFFKKGKRLYFRETDLENWLLSGRKLTREEIKAKGSGRFNQKGGKE